MKLTNIEELQNFLLRSLENLENDEIDVTEMAVIAKSSEAIFSSLKLRLTYNAMRKEKPEIKFLQDANEGQPIDDVKKLSVGI